METGKRIVKTPKIPDPTINDAELLSDTSSLGRECPQVLKWFKALRRFASLWCRFRLY